MSEVGEKVRDHFHDDAARFDAIYEEEKGLVTRFIDNWWRGVVRKRLEINVEKFKPFEGKRILDVGCGSGRFCFEYAKNGAKEAVGIDFAQGMIDISNKLANEMGVADKWQIRSWNVSRRFAERYLRRLISQRLFRLH